MKTKILKLEGYYKLVVDDKEINDKSKYGGPILLACITHFFDSGCWSFDDYRLSEHFITSPYLNDSDDTIYDFKNLPQVDKDLILSKIHTYEMQDEHLHYWRFNTTDLEGDIPQDDKRRQFSTGDFLTKGACFTFKNAYDKLRETKKFWDSYEGELNNPEVKRENKFRQPHSSSFYFELSANKEKFKNLKIK